MASKNLRDEHLVSGYYFTVAESLNNMRQSQIIQATSSNSVTGKSLSLDENLSRLFECLKLEYGSNYRLVSPKWKNFRSQKLPFSEKTRLNNAIWRCWHIQYLKGRRPYFCQFVSPLSEEREPPKKEQLAVILEGRYWKRKLEAVAREYKRWRVYYKEKWSRSTPETALENLSIQAQICDQQIFDDLERRQKMRKRTISGSSGDPFSAASPTEYCPSRALKMVQEQMTQEMVLSVYPDTLFTSTTNDQQASSASSSFGPTDAPDLFLQPRLDNLQPCLDEFMEQFDTLTNLMVQNEAEALVVKQKQHQVTANMQGQLVVPGQNRPRSLSAQYTGNPGEIEMMDATGYNSLQVQDYSGGSGSGSRQVCTLTQELCPGTLGLSADYDRLSVQLEQPPEQMQQDNNVFGMQQELSSRLQIQSPTNITSPLPNSPISSPILSSPGIVSPVTTATLTQPQMLSQQRLNRSGSLSSEPMLESGSYFSNTQTQEMSAPKKGRLPRNVSDSQLYTMDLSQLGSSFASTLHNTSLMPSLESNLPPQLQAPNLAAHLQSVPSRTSRPAIQETRSTTGSQPKKARIPRNMSDSGLYTLANLSKTGSSSLNRQMSSPDQVLGGQLDIQAQDNLQTQTPAHPVRQPRMTGKRRGRIPRNMSDSSLMTIQNLPRNMSDSSLLAMHQKQQQQQQQQQQHLQAPTVASLLMGDNATRRGNVSTTPNSLADLLSSTSSNQVFVSSEQTNLITTSVPFSSSSSAVREVPPSTLIDQLLKEPTAQLTASSLPSSNILEALVQTTTQKTSQTSSCILTSATSTQPVVVQPEESAKVSPQQQLLKHLLALQKDKQPLPTHLLAALQASVDQHSLRSKQNGARLQHQQQLQQQNLQQKVQHEQQHQQGHQNFMQVQQQQEQVLKAQQYNLSPAQPQTQQMLPQQNAQTDQKEVSPLQAVLQIPSAGLQPTQPLVVGGNSETQNFPPGTLVITPQQLQLASLQNLPSKVVTLQQNNPQPVQSPPVSGSSQIVEIVQGNGPPQKFVLPTGMKIRQGVQAVVAAPELSSLLLGQQQSQTPARGYSTVQSPSTSSESTESIAAALVSMATSPVVQQPPMTTPAQVPMVSVARSTSSQDSASERAPQATPTAPKPIRPVCSYDREQYKETRRISHISAEQKRRGNIKMGFDELVLMVPSLAQQRNVKVSKATVLQKTVEYTMKLQRDRQLMSEEIELLQHQKEELKAEIDACQQQLPATGAPVMTQRSEQLWAMFNEYVRSKTQQNYKFWIFSLIIRPLFEAYISSVSTSSVEEFCRTVLSWLDQRCSLPALRPIPVAALRELSQHTSILTDPSKIADEAQKAAAVDNPSSISGSLETIFGSHDGSSEVSNGTEFNASLR